MNRLLVYPGAIPLDTDQLTPQKNTLIALGYALAATVGIGTYLDGFTCIPTGPASQSVQVTAGQILSVQNVDGSAFGSLGADTTHQIIKQGLLLDTVSFTCAAPITSGQSINYLIEVGYNDVDGNPIVLPYYNAANPAVAWAGPNNTGVAQNTTRTGLAVVQVKPGTPATTGTQTTPTPDVGFTGAFVVTVAFGQTTITSASIAAYKPTSFIPAKLPTIPASVQNNAYQYAAAGGTSTAYTLTTTPASTALVTGASVLVFFGTPNTTTTPTLNRDGLGALTIVKSNGLPVTIADLTGFITLIYNGTQWQIDGYVSSDVLQPVTANVTLYVRTDGSDSNNGSANTAGSAFLTIAAAMNYAITRNSFGGFGLTIQLGNAGTYTAVLATPPGLPSTTIKGDVANQGNYILAGSPPSSGTAVVSVSNGSSVSLQGLTVRGVSPGSGSSILSVSGGATIQLTNVTVSSAIAASYGIVASGGGTMIINAGCILNMFSTSGYGLYATYGGLLNINASVSIPTAQLYAGAFAAAIANGTIAVTSGTFTGAGVAGSTGPRYQAQLNGVINTGGGGASYFPGNSAGTTTTGGQYA